MFAGSRLNRIVCGFAFAGVTLLSVTDSSDASDWAFRRSYFSHAPGAYLAEVPQPHSRSAYRVPYAPEGIAVRGIYRYDNVFLRSGNSVERTLIWEGSLNVRP